MKNSNKSTHQHYTNIQYFFWLFSGAEIHILKECPTDYNRQAGIGFTIFMTTLFAMFAGGYAGWYFSKDIWVTIVFSIIWGLLIFSIDRTLVVTLKKDPDNPKQNFWLQFGGRAVLAGLIAFIISIPLELLIFRDKIEEQKMIDKDETLKDYRNILGESRGINAQKDISSRAQESRELAEKNANDCKTDPVYNNLETERKSLENTWLTRRKTKDAAINRYNSIYNSGQRDAAANYRKSATYQNALSNFNKIDKEYQSILRQQKNRCNEYVAEQTSIIQQQNKIQSEANINANKGLSTADSLANVLDSLQKESFIRDYVALENAAKRKILVKETKYINGEPQEVNVYKDANEGMFKFLWLIRILFFVIEVLPTLAKIATPPGAYDRAIKKREDDYALDLESKTIDYLMKQQEFRDIEHQHQIQLEKDRMEIEQRHQKEILENLVKAQNQVAIKEIEEFKTKRGIE